MLFGKKQETQELEEKLNNCRQQYEKIEKKIKRAKELGKDTEPCFESQIASQNEMDKQLTKVVGFAHQSIATSRESKKAIEKLSTDLIELRGRLEEEEAKKRRLVEDMDGCLENLLSYGDAADKAEKPLGQEEEGMLDELGQARAVVSDMKEFSKQMNVLCLHNAVEAGRMGEIGRPLIESAQNVQQFAEKYGKAAAKMDELLHKLEERVGQMEGRHSDVLDKTQADAQHWKGLAVKLEEQLSVCGELSQNNFSDRLYLLSSEIRLLLDNQEGIQSLQQNTLSEMENIGESFMDEQEARKELERIFDKIMKSME